ncbi:hypothetical protein [Nonomuraea composti]|nr:hypothetical protein [Nonomuraea sp. FMUSA5-5]
MPYISSRWFHRRGIHTSKPMVEPGTGLATPWTRQNAGTDGSARPSGAV